MTFKLSSISKSALSAKLSVMPLLQNLLVKKTTQVWQMAENIYNDEDPDTPAADLDDKP